MKRKNLAVLVGSLSVAIGTLLAQEKEKEAKAEPPKKVPIETLRNAKTIVPAPAELFAHLNEISSSHWKEIVGTLKDELAKKPDAFKDKPTQAANLGIYIADAFVAIKAQDKEAFMDAAKLVKELGSELGAKETIVKKADDARELADKREWKKLTDLVETIRGEVVLQMEESDRDLATIATVCGWLQGLHLVADALSEQYSEKASTVLRQSGLVANLKEMLGKLGDDTKAHPKVNALLDQLNEIEKLTTVPQGKPVAKEDVKKLNQISGDLVKGFQS